MKATIGWFSDIVESTSKEREAYRMGYEHALLRKPPAPIKKVKGKKKK